MMKNCLRCGNAEISPGANFCKICGIRLDCAKEVMVLINKCVTPEQYKREYEKSWNKKAAR